MWVSVHSVLFVNLINQSMVLSYFQFGYKLPFTITGANVGQNLHPTTLFQISLGESVIDTQFFFNIIHWKWGPTTVQCKMVQKVKLKEMSKYFNHCKWSICSVWECGIRYWSSSEAISDADCCAYANMWECKIGYCLLLQARPAIEAHKVLKSHRSSESPKHGGNCVNILSW